MTIKSPAPLKVLFVDDNAAFLDMVERVFSGWTRGSWQFLRAGNAGRALEILDEQVVDLVVIDLHLPGLDGVQFVHLLQRRYANVPKAVMTGHPDDDTKAACLAGGADVYLAKPQSLDDMEGVFATLNQIARWRQDAGFRGIMRQVTLPEILQLECLNRNSLILEVASGTRGGQVFIEEGNIIHAHGGGHRGAAALAYLLGLKGGEFSLKPFSPPAEITIEGSWEALLMEAAQASDEGAEAVPEPARPDGAPEGNLPLPDPLPQPFPPDEVKTLLDADEILAPRVEEMLVCSPKGDVLYEWHCPAPDARLALLETVRRTARELQDLLGDFDRLDAQDGKNHIIVRLQQESRIFLRTFVPGGGVNGTSAR